MKFKTRALGMIVGVSVLATATILGTLAYLTDKKEVTNTFTDGKVKITLDESAVKDNGTAKDPAKQRVIANTYKAVPGRTYYKDPTVTLLSGSEEAFIRVKVTFTNYKRLQHAGVNIPNPNSMLDINDHWKLVKHNGQDGVVGNNGNTITYEYRYDTIAKPGPSIPPVFEHFTIPGSVTQDGVRLLAGKDLDGTETVHEEYKVKIEVVANAIQAEGFNKDANKAWAAFDQQNP